MKENSDELKYALISQNIDKKKIKSFQRQIGDASSMKISKRLGTAILFLIFFGIMMYGIGIGMPEGFESAKSNDIHVISIYVAQAVAEIGQYVSFLVKLSIFVWIILAIIFVWPKKILFVNYLVEKSSFYGLTFVHW